MEFLPLRAPLHLTEAEVHVWRAGLDGLASFEPHWLSLLSPDEQDRAKSFRFPAPQRRFVITRGLLRGLLGSYLNIDPRAVCLRRLDKGKPVLDGQPANGALQFNVSHSENVALLAFSLGHEVGVDVELVCRNAGIEDLAQRFFSESEKACLATLPPQQKHQAFFHCWTRKEAFIKAVGLGLSLPLHQFDVSLAPDQPAQLLATRPDPKERERWSLWTIDAGPEYAAALAVRGTNLRVVTRDVSAIMEPGP